MKRKALSKLAWSGYLCVFNTLTCIFCKSACWPSCASCSFKNSFSISFFCWNTKSGQKCHTISNPKIWGCKFSARIGWKYKMLQFPKSEVSDVSSPNPPWGAATQWYSAPYQNFLNSHNQVTSSKFRHVAVTNRAYPPQGLGRQNTEICTKLSIQSSLDLSSLCVHIAMECGKGH